MDNKTKVKVAVVIGIVILAIIFIFMVVFVKGNRTPVNKNIPRKSDANYVDPTQNDPTEDEQEPVGEPISLDNVESLGIKNGNLVKIGSDLNSNIVKKLKSGFTEYCYGNNNVFTVINNEDGTYSVIEIDLSNSEYPEKTIITTSEYGSITNIEYFAEKLYFVSEKGQLIEYSIPESFFKALTKENEVKSFVLNKNNNSIILSYKPNGQDSGIYVLDFTSNSFTKIISLNDFAGKLLLNGKTLVIDVKEFNKLYAYDIENNTVVEIGNDNYLALAENHVAFYNDLLLYTNGTAIDIRDSSGNVYQNGWYTLDERTIASISMLSSSKLQVAKVGGGSIIVDLINGTTEEMPDNSYTNVIRIK